MATSVQETADLLRAVLADLAPVVGNIPPEQLHRPTPCTEWDVTQLRNHTVGWLTLFAAGFADPKGQAPRVDVEGYTVADDPAAEGRSAADTMDDALRNGAAERRLRWARTACRASSRSA